MTKFICPSCGRTIEVVSPDAIVHCHRCGKRMVKSEELSTKIEKTKKEVDGKNDNE